MKLRLQNDLTSISVSDVVFTALLAIVVAGLLKLFVIGAFQIPSSSMERTLLPGDFIMVSKLAFNISAVERGDIIVFDLPDSIRSESSPVSLIKRVVGTPGDTVRLTPSVAYVNGNAQPNPPLSASTDLIPKSLLPIGGNLDRTVVVPAGHYFVLGDNRANSFDSRFWGCLPASAIVGAPLFVYWSHGADAADLSAHVRWNRIFTGIR